MDDVLVFIESPVKQLFVSDPEQNLVLTLNVNGHGNL